MFVRSAFRANTAASIIGRRGFTSSRSQLASGFHYPEGPRSNIPFNPLTKFFFVRYWAFMITGFSLPFAIAVWQTKKSR
ncbi:cytochrome c oxidase subunit 8p [Arthroderma uncinatum]|uniref:cytochrome c oxidase subunit 8p n=1 Tax=Arthroderma uncinatum TaxID=74035 RepID=UPI00144A7E6E|nr:cytochrome c oxidase subunit 8p [Arthroderma uncinatum]KAF3491899.1 cytochrome c oxidase subunit 8p [Arthroderma uncinatum]